MLQCIDQLLILGDVPLVKGNANCMKSQAVSPPWLLRSSGGMLLMNMLPAVMHTGDAFSCERRPWSLYPSHPEAFRSECVTTYTWAGSSACLYLCRRLVKPPSQLPLLLLERLHQDQSPVYAGSVHFCCVGRNPGCAIAVGDRTPD